MTSEIHEALRRASIRVTAPRVAILRALSRVSRPISADQLAAKLRVNRIDRVTVYRTLETLEHAGIARRVDFHTGQALYEVRDGHDHHHLVCTGCGLIEDFTGCEVDTLAKRALSKSRSFSTVTDHSFELFGTCNNCAA